VIRTVRAVPAIHLGEQAFNEVTSAFAVINMRPAADNWSPSNRRSLE
jgi:hypothetical protein